GVGGDSMAEAFGSSFVELASHLGPIHADLDFRSSTGLSRPDYFDWPAHFREELVRLRPEAVVVMFGANDAQAFELDGDALAFRSASWEAEYRRRVSTVMDQLTGGGRR